MSGLNQQDLQILGHYARNGNRELYWNYLAQMPGNDGYGLLALGVVRNDNAPGQVANLYADMRARDGGRNMSERDWENFGADLIRQDLALRRAQFADNNPERALNLPARDVQTAHDNAFHNARIDPNAWTPRVLLEAARNGRGEGEVERIWTHMLDNDYRGGERMYYTLGDIARNMPAGEAAAYTARLGLVRTMAATGAHPNTDPDTIGGHPLTYHYNTRDGRWSQTSSGGEMSHISEVRDARLLAELNDARGVRLHRQDLRDDFHPADPNRNRPIVASPWVVADNGPAPGTPDTRLASAEALPSDPRQTGHARHALYCQCRDGAHQLGGTFGPGGQDGDRLGARLFQLASDQRFASVDAVLVGGQNAFIVQGDPIDPASRRAHVGLREALDTPVERSLQVAADNRAAAPAEPAQEPQRTAARAMV
ncbi:XVIPCD domain-containing protein [Lysobacter sp. CA199]|uniref:XVIPCD domain-containing protein n=1 Tax=Lysobacter sp. CA199 TaxID=3455608 RepID=UPI003F8D5ACD